MFEHDEATGPEYWREENDDYECDRWLKIELANNVGKNVRIATGYAEFLHGRILGVKDDSVFLEDSRGSRIVCRTDMICYVKISKERKKAAKRLGKSRQSKTPRKS